MKLNFHSENSKLPSKGKICRKAILEQSQGGKKWSEKLNRKLMS